MIQMADPTLTVYSRPIYFEETTELGEINLDSLRMNIGIYVKDNDGNQLTIPEEVGRIRMFTTENGPKGETTYSPLVPCVDVFKSVNEDIGDQEQLFLAGGLCMDPT